MRDPRLAQILVLLALCLWGALALDFEVEPGLAAVVGGCALATQALGARLCGMRFDPRSPMISALSLTLLLRSDDLVFGALAAVLAVGSKFLFRWNGKHLFNPTNFALVVLLLASDRVWVSSGQWGSEPLLAAALVAGAGWILPRARGDITLSFLGCWISLLIGRSLWLGDPLAIPLHQLQSGSLLLFAGFMISDPRTIPNSRGGRSAFAALVALAGFALRFGFHEPNALLYALAAAAPLVPALDHLRPGRRFAWPDKQEKPDARPLSHPDAAGLRPLPLSGS
jgi:Na+-transporting NADH:ubiquinone oxidoreductase subunit NqrB